jgi:uncharacterized protein
MSHELAMFPLGTVLLPGQIIPLHIFEDRYRTLVADIVAIGEATGSLPRFGIVLIERGSEVGGGDVRAGVGTTAEVVDLRSTSDGRYGLVCLGRRRFAVREWLPDAPYPRARVEVLPEGEADELLSSAIERLVPRVRQVLALAIELGDVNGDPTTPITDDPVLATYQLGGLLPVGPADRLALLSVDGPHERVALLEDLLDHVDAVQRFRLTTGSDGS